MYVKYTFFNPLLYFLRLKMVDILINSLDEAESQVRKNENRLSEEDIVPADIAAIKSLRDQLGVTKPLTHHCQKACQNSSSFFVFVFSQKWQAELPEHEAVFHTLQSQVDRAKEVGSQLSRLHPDRSPELERYQERASQMVERWSGIKRQMETRYGVTIAFYSMFSPVSLCVYVPIFLSFSFVFYMILSLGLIADALIWKLWVPP